MSEKINKIIHTARNLVDTLESKHSIPVRLFGSGAIALQCWKNISLWDQLNRKEINDLDLVTFKENRTPIREAMKSMGYVEDGRLSKVWENQYGRLLLHPPHREFPIEIFFTPIALHHDLDLQNTLTIERWTITITDLVLSKLQYEIMDRKQLIDLTLLFMSHIVQNNECQSICCNRILDSILKDWKLRKTIEKNLLLFKAFVNEKEIRTKIEDPVSIIRKIETIFDKVRNSPKQWFLKPIELTYLRFGWQLGRPIDSSYADRWSS